MSLSSEIIGEKETSFNSLSNKRTLWDKVEQLFHGQLNDQNSLKTNSKVFDPKLATLALERSYRVMSQLPTGKVIGISKNDIGDAKLKSLLMDKYVLKNANAQFDFLTKMRMVDLYSGIYGNFFTLTDWDVKKNGYIGPDVWLLNIRDVFPQVGAVSLEDSDSIIVRTWRPLSFFENLKKQNGYKNVPDIISILKDKSGSKQKRDSDAKSKREEDQYPDQDSTKNGGYYEVLTRYERDRWVDVVVDADKTFRDQKNPHDNGELPVDCKYSIPLLDDFMGYGDFERGGSMQMFINSNWNLYGSAVKMSIFPPMLINKDNIASASSMKYNAAAKWLGKGNIQNFAQPLNLTPQGIQTFNNVHQVANSSILNLYGTTDTTVTSQTDPGMGKTPDAIKFQSQRENTRDNADRFFMEQYMGKVMKKMVNLLNKKQNGKVEIRMFKEEIDQMAREYPEIRDQYDEETGKLSIKKGNSSMLYDYEIVSGSTYAVDQKSQQENLSMLLDMYNKAQTPQGNMLVADLDKSGYKFNFGELFKKLVAMGGIQDWDKILTEKTEEEKDASALQEDQQILQQAMQQAMGGMAGGMGGGMNGIPPTPDEQGGPIQ